MIKSQATGKQYLALGLSLMAAGAGFALLKVGGGPWPGAALGAWGLILMLVGASRYRQGA